MPRKVRGLRRHGAGWQTYCTVNGERRVQSWPFNEDMAKMLAWLRQQRAQKQTGTVRLDLFEVDAERYLGLVKSMPSYADRKRDIERWRDVLRGYRRKDITATMIRAQREAWTAEKVAPSTVNKRLRALSNLWTVLDGRKSANPVREVPELPEPEGPIRAVPLALIERLIAAMPDRGRPVRNQPRAKESKTKARLTVMLRTGLTHIELGRLTRTDWHQAEATVRVLARHKGAGGLSRVLPLSPKAQEAFAHLDAIGAWGTFSRSSVHTSFRRACETVAEHATPEEQALLKTLRPYDIRHSYASALYRQSGDAFAASHALGQRSAKTTKRYVRSVVQEKVTLAVHTLP